MRGLFGFLAITFVLAGVSSGQSAPAAPERVRVRTRRKRLHLSVRYPEISGLGDRRLQSRMNSVLQGAYPPPHGLRSMLPKTVGYLRDPDMPRGTTVEVDGSYQVTLNQSHLLSAHFSGDWVVYQNERPLGTGPTHLYAGVTLDTRTGRPLGWSELFAGRDWRSRLDDRIAQRAAQRLNEYYSRYHPGTGEDQHQPEDLFDQISSHDYWYYLTPKRIIFYDLFSSYAVRSAEADFTYAELRDLINPTGTVARLLKLKPVQ